jgi:hypothetical protein
MAVAELKTKKNRASVAGFLAGVKDEQRRKDCQAISKLMKAATGEPPKMWGASMVGFGQVRIVGKSREVDWFKVGFSPRKGDLTLYLGLNLDPLQPELEKLGRHKRGKGCLYLRALADVDLEVLRRMIAKVAKGIGS